MFSNPVNHSHNDEKGRIGSNCHCNVVEICGLGILIFGPSGSGKTSLALGLVDCFLARGKNAVLVADDQAIFEMRNERLFASVPEPIAGMAELRGFGIIKRHYKTQAEIHLAVTLEEDKMVERMPQERHISVLETRIPHLKLPKQHEAQGIRIVSAWINDRK